MGHPTLKRSTCLSPARSKVKTTLSRSVTLPLSPDVWWKRASARWLAANESEVRQMAGNQLAIIETGSGKTATVEVADASLRRLERVRGRFGGRIVMLPRDWLRNFLHLSAGKPLKVG